MLPSGQLCVSDIIRRWITPPSPANQNLRQDLLTAHMTILWKPVTSLSSPLTVWKVWDMLQWSVEPVYLCKSWDQRCDVFCFSIRHCSWYCGLHWRSHRDGPHRHADLRTGDWENTHRQGDWALYSHHHRRGCLPRTFFLRSVNRFGIQLAGGRHFPHWNHRC